MRRTARYVCSAHASGTSSATNRSTYDQDTECDASERAAGEERRGQREEHQQHRQQRPPPTVAEQPLRDAPVEIGVEPHVRERVRVQRVRVSVHDVGDPPQGTPEVPGRGDHGRDEHADSEIAQPRRRSPADRDGCAGGPRVPRRAGPRRRSARRDGPAACARPRRPTTRTRHASRSCSARTQQPPRDQCERGEHRVVAVLLRVPHRERRDREEQTREDRHLPSPGGARA